MFQFVISQRIGFSPNKENYNVLTHVDLQQMFVSQTKLRWLVRDQDPVWPCCTRPHFAVLPPHLSPITVCLSGARKCVILFLMVPTFRLGPGGGEGLMTLNALLLDWDHSLAHGLVTPSKHCSPRCFLKKLTCNESVGKTYKGYNSRGKWNRWDNPRAVAGKDRPSSCLPSASLMVGREARKG